MNIARILLLSLAALGLTAQEGPPIRLWKGKILEWTPAGDGGEYSLRGHDFHVQRCRFGSDLWVERDRAKIELNEVETGAWVEAVVDVSAGLSRCRTLTLYVIPQPEREDARKRLRLRLPTSQGFLDNLWPRGNLTFAGLVSRLGPDHMVLRTRDTGWQTFVLRRDTTYSAEGRLVSVDHLRPQMMVYVRAGRSLDGALEAYQVIWGHIVGRR